jgi:hypothetical protein
MPDNQNALDRLVADVERLRSEFGRHYAYIQPDRVKPFLDRIEELTDFHVRLGEVKYSDKPERWSPPKNQAGTKPGYLGDYRVCRTRRKTP